MKSSNSILSVSLLINLLLISSLIFLVLFQKSPNFVSESPREPEVTTNDLDERVVLDERVEAPKADVSSEGQTLNASEAASPDFSSLLEELEELDLRIVPARLVRHLDVRVLNSNGSLSDEIQKLFSLGEEEIGRLNEILTGTANQLRELEVEKMELNPIGENKVEFRIPPIDSEISEKFKTDLRQNLRRELGDVDGGLLWDLMRGPHNSKFWDSFGDAGVRLILTTSEAGEGKTTLQFEQKPYDEDWTQFMTSFGGASGEFGWFFDSYLWRRSYLLDYLPEEMQKRILAPED